MIPIATLGAVATGAVGRDYFCPSVLGWLKHAALLRPKFDAVTRLFERFPALPAAIFLAFSLALGVGMWKTWTKLQSFPTAPQTATSVNAATAAGTNLFNFIFDLTSLSRTHFKPFGFGAGCVRASSPVSSMSTTRAASASTSARPPNSRTLRL